MDNDDDYDDTMIVMELVEDFLQAAQKENLISDRKLTKLATKDSVGLGPRHLFRREMAIKVTSMANGTDFQPFARYWKG